MPQNITDVDTWSTPLTCEADGDAVNGTNRLTHEQKSANRSEFLRKRVFGTEEDDVVWVPFPCATPGGKFLLQSSGLQQDSVTSPLATIDLHEVLPKNCVIREMHCTLIGATGHAGDPPATTMPRVRLLSKDPGSASAAVEEASATDTVATAAAYEVVHSISDTGLAVVVTNDGGERFYLEFRGESGGNAIIGMIILNLYFVVDPS